jgi:uncharacterized protein with HEPN domain
MRRSPKPYLHDLIFAARDIISMADGKRLDDYLHDSLLQSAIERKFIVMGEALFQLKSYFPHLLAKIPESRSLIAFRHVLVHGYNQVADDLTWGMIETRVRPALSAAETMLNDSRLV